MHKFKKNKFLMIQFLEKNGVKYINKYKFKDMLIEKYTQITREN